MRNRQKQRELRRLQKKNAEAPLDRRNACGVKDLTAYNAVQQIRTNGKATIAYR